MHDPLATLHPIIAAALRPMVTPIQHPDVSDQLWRARVKAGDRRFAEDPVRITAMGALDDEPHDQTTEDSKTWHARAAQ